MHTHDPEITAEGAPTVSAADAIAEARRVLAEDTQARMQACAAEIEAVLRRHGMRLDVTPAQIVLTPTSGETSG